MAAACSMTDIEINEQAKLVDLQHSLVTKTIWRQQVFINWEELDMYKTHLHEVDHSGAGFEWKGQKQWDLQASAYLR